MIIHVVFGLVFILENYKIRYSVTAITSRFHRGDRGSTPRIGEAFNSI